MQDKPEDVTEGVVKELAEKAHDLDAVRKSVDDAASVSGTLWFSYLFALFYIGIAAGGVSHKDLLLENAVKLPFLNVELPLVAFFFLAPILFVISHAYTLMHFVLLAAKVGTFNSELKKKVPEPHATPAETASDDRATELHEIRLGLRRQLPINIFVQFLAGPRDIRDGILGWLLKVVAWISLVIGPVLLLLLLQIQFLPYHLWWVTWVQRFAILLDVTLLWLLWPAVLASRSTILWPRPWHSRVLAFLALLSLIPVGLAFTAATFPGECMDEHVGKKQWIPLNALAGWLGAKDLYGTPRWTSFHDLLFNGDVDLVTRRRASWFSNTLVLPSFDALEAAKIDDPKKLDNESVKQSLVLRGRNLEGAVLARADLRKADLEGAQLQAAELFNAQLQGASLQGAQLQGASLFAADLQGASLFWAQLEGATLDFARLQGAVLVEARLQGASLDNAQLQGASLFETQLQGASLDFAGLQGASLDHAQLQGASLQRAQLQGANFGNASLVGVDMRFANIWRAYFEDSHLAKVFEDNLSEEPLLKEDFAALKDNITKVVPAAVSPENLILSTREAALRRIEILDPDVFGPEADARKTLEDARVDWSAYEKARAEQLKSLICFGGQEAPVIVRRLIMNDHTHSLIEDNAQSASLVETILGKDCPISAALTDWDKAALKNIQKSAAKARRLGSP